MTEAHKQTDQRLREQIEGVKSPVKSSEADELACCRKMLVCRRFISPAPDSSVLESSLVKELVEMICLQSAPMCVCVCACVRACVCVCVCARARECE